MALTERDRPYETLIRHHEDGSIGAHHVRINEILRDGIVIQASVGTAIPLATADGQGGLKLSEVLGEATSLALKRVDAVTADYVALTTMHESTLQERDEAKALVEQLQWKVAELTRQLGEAQASLVSVAEQLVDAQSRATALEEILGEAKDPQATSSTVES